MSGVFRRRIQLEKKNDQIHANLEDDFHRFSVCVQHNGRAVTEISAQTIRYPWSTCPEASQVLNELVSNPLSSSPMATLLRANCKIHCMHLLDLAGLAITHSQRREKVRTYDCCVPDRINGATTPCLKVKGRTVLSWQVHGNTITSPDPFADVNLKRFIPWANQILDHETLEYGLILRRAVFVSQGRMVDLDLISRLSDFPGTPACYSYQPENLDRAWRMTGSSHDFSENPETLLDDLKEPR